MNTEHFKAVLGLHPTSRGMGFVLATSPVDLVDFGVIRARGDVNLTCLTRFIELLDTFSPAVIVVRDVLGEPFKRVKRIQTLVEAIVRTSKLRNIEVNLFQESEVRKHFERFGAKTRDEIIAFLADNIEALSSRRPPKRRAWMTIDPRTGLFDAAALMVTFFVERDLLEHPFAPQFA